MRRVIFPMALLVMMAMVPAATACAPAICHGLTVTIPGTDGVNNLNGTAGSDVIHDGDGDDDDTAYGDAGNDYLFGATWYVGGPGPDGCDASPIVDAEWHGREIIGTYD